VGGLDFSPNPTEEVEVILAWRAPFAFWTRLIRE